MAEGAWPTICSALALHAAGELTDCDLVGVYILSLHAAARKGAWCSGRLRPPVLGEAGPSVEVDKVPGLLELLGGAKYMEKKQVPAEATTVASIFNNMALSSLKGNKNGSTINLCMVQWSLGRRPFRLMKTVPSPLTVLKQQAAGERVVTIFATKVELSQLQSSPLVYMDGAPNHTRDALEFTCHDLLHMENFCVPHFYKEQVGFFRAISLLGSRAGTGGGGPKDFFINVCGLDVLLWQQLEYVISDMNCVVPHLLLYMLAKIVAACRRRDGNKERGGQEEGDGGAEAEERTKRVWNLLLDNLGMHSDDSHEARSAAEGLLLDGALKPKDAEALRDWFRALAV